MSSNQSSWFNFYSRIRIRTLFYFTFFYFPLGYFKTIKTYLKYLLCWRMKWWLFFGCFKNTNRSLWSGPTRVSGSKHRGQPFGHQGFLPPVLSNQEGLGGRQQGRANLSSIWTPTWYRLQGSHAACTILESRSIVKSPALPNFLALLPRGTGNYKGPAT